MKLLTDRLSEESREESYAADPAWCDAHLGLHEAQGDASVPGFDVKLSARMVGADLLLEGLIEGLSEHTCGRCLARYGAPIREPFRLVLEPAGQRIPAEPEGAEALASDGLCLTDELETGWFRGPEIKLDRLVAEVLLLALPAQSLCRADCKGLCPVCGVDRNEQTCDCSEARPKSPFAALEKLRGVLPGGPPEGETR